MTEITYLVCVCSFVVRVCVSVPVEHVCSCAIGNRGRHTMLRMIAGKHHAVCCMFEIGIEGDFGNDDDYRVDKHSPDISRERERERNYQRCLLRRVCALQINVENHIVLHATVRGMQRR